MLEEQTTVEAVYGALSVPSHLASGSDSQLHFSVVEDVISQVLALAPAATPPCKGEHLSFWNLKSK